jgi:repressor LexA
MKALTRRQQDILEFIGDQQRLNGVTPTFQEIADHFEFRSLTTVADHLRLLRQKGWLAGAPGRARSLRVLSPLQTYRQPVADIPILGSIPAGFPQDGQQEVIGCVSVDIETIGIKPNARTFALEVHGDSMIGRHIQEGDLVVLEHGMTPRHGDVVAALIDNESTLKTFVLDRGKPWLRAENPRYPKMVPASELVIQGVMVALIRKRK